MELVERPTVKFESDPFKRRDSIDENHYSSTQTLVLMRWHSLR
jgi:hypothetical protein